jgi:hypothetical protein
MGLAERRAPGPGAGRVQRAAVPFSQFFSERTEYYGVQLQFEF